MDTTPDHANTETGSSSPLSLAHRFYHSHLTPHITRTVGAVLSSKNDTFASLAQGKYDEAESLCRRVLEIWEESLGPEHPNVAVASNNLAELLRAQVRAKYAELSGSGTRTFFVCVCVCVVCVCESMGDFAERNKGALRAAGFFCYFLSFSREATESKYSSFY